jgi:hypothetical protein
MFPTRSLRHCFGHKAAAPSSTTPGHRSPRQPTAAAYAASKYRCTIRASLGGTKRAPATHRSSRKCEGFVLGGGLCGLGRGQQSGINSRER